MSYNVGNTVRLALDTTQPGTPPVRADADSITLTITNPDDTTVTAVYPGPGTNVITRSGAGAYYFDATAVAVGTTIYQWNAVGTDPTPWTVVRADQFNTDDLAPRLISLTEAKRVLGYGPDDDGSDDDELLDMIDSVTSSLEQHCGPIIPRVVTQTLWGWVVGGARIVARQWPIITLIDLDGDPAGVAGWTFDNEEGGIITVPAAATGTTNSVLRLKVGRQPFTPCLRDGGKELLKYRWRGGRQRSMATPGNMFTPDDYDARPTAADMGGGYEPVPLAVLEIIGDELIAKVA